jgi:hypothetical protein
VKENRAFTDMLFYGIEFRVARRYDPNKKNNMELY